MLKRAKAQGGTFGMFWTVPTVSRIQFKIFLLWNFFVLFFLWDLFYSTVLCEDIPCNGTVERVHTLVCARENTL